MGKRILFVDGQWFVDFLKARGGEDRSYKVIDHPLPDDAQLVGYETAISHGLERGIALILESPAWYGDSREELPPPAIRMTIIGRSAELATAPSEVR